MTISLRKASFVLVILFVMLSIAVLGAAAARSPFMGHWESTDIDGSHQILAIGGGPGGSHRLTLRDFGATVCGLRGGEPYWAASGRGSGTVSGTTLSGEWDVYCHTHSHVLAGTFEFNFEYDNSADTLTDGLGVIWSRR